MGRRNRHWVWTASRGRHRGPGTVERAVRRSQRAGLEVAVAISLLATMVWVPPVFDPRI